MKKILLIMLILLALALPVSADAAITYYFEDNSGNYLDNVDAIVYTCQDAGCNSVTIPTEIVPNYGNSNDYGLNYDITITYPAELETQYGYAVYYTKACYLPVESDPNWHGWGSDNLIIKFNQKEDAIAEISNFFVSDDEVEIGETVGVSADIGSAFSDYIGAPEYTPDHLKETYYSADTTVKLLVKKDDEIVQWYSESLNIYMDEFESVDFEWTPTEAGTYVLELTSYVPDCQVDNSIGQIETATVVVREPECNHPPVLDPIDDIVVYEGETVYVYTYAYDEDGDELFFDISDPNFVEIAPGDYSWQTQIGDAGVYNDIEICVNDGEFSDCETFNVEVLEVTCNQPPELDPIEDITVYEGEPVYVYTYAYDPEGDALTFSIDDANFNEIALGDYLWETQVGDHGTYPVEICVSDGEYSDCESFTVNVLELFVPNDPPKLDFIGNKEICEGESLQFTISGSDPNGDVLSYYAEHVPSGASFDEDTQTFSWEPGYDTVLHPRPTIINKIKHWITPLKRYFYVTFGVSDGQYNDEEQVRIGVCDVNRDPILGPVHDITIYEGEYVLFLAIATDPDQEDIDWLKFTVSDPLSHGFWQTQIGDAGVYNIDVEVTDGYGGYASDSFTLTVLEVHQNHAPELDSIGDKEICLGETVEFDVSATDVDGDSLSYFVNAPAGVFYTFANQHFTWTPQSLGSFDFVFGVNDGQLSDTELVTMEVIDCVEPSFDSHVHRFSVMAYPLSLKVRPGETLTVYSRVRNTGTEDEDLSFRLVVQELGLRIEKSIEVKNSHDSHVEFFEIDVPRSARKGVYLGKVTAYNQDHMDYKLFTFEVV